MSDCHFRTTASAFARSETLAPVLALFLILAVVQIRVKRGLFIPDTRVQAGGGYGTVSRPVVFLISRRTQLD